ncbi:MAG: C4-type zinc ribbon domain-containing protein [bacterium]
MTAIDVRRELEKVARLQEVDAQLRDLELEKGDLPALVKKLHDEIESKEQEKKELEHRLADVSKQQRTNDGQIQLTRVKLDKYKEQLYTVTTNREYDAINQEIDHLRGQIESIESSQKALKEEEESLGEQIEDFRTRLDEMNNELKERRNELGSKQGDSEEEENQLGSERDRLIVQIKKPIVAHYERIRNLRSVGSARLYEGACGACFAVVPPQRQAEIRKAEDVILCESCGVILLPEEDYLVAAK